MTYSKYRYGTELTILGKTNIYIVKHTEPYQFIHRYTMNKIINTNTDIMQVQWYNYSCTGNIHKQKIPKIEKTQG